MPFIGTQPEVGGYSVLDALTASATASYTLQLNSANFVPNTANQLLVSLNGVIQKPGSSFTVSGSTLTFSSALASSDSIDFIIAMGEPLLIGTPSDGTVNADKLATNAVTSAKIATDAITQAKIATGAVDATELASTLNLASKTLTIPTTSVKPMFVNFYPDGLLTITNDTMVKLNMNVQGDTNGLTWDTTNYRCTFDANTAGKYLIIMSVSYYNNNNNFSECLLQIRKDNSTVNHPLFDASGTGGGVRMDEMRHITRTAMTVEGFTSGQYLDFWVQMQVGAGSAQIQSRLYGTQGFIMRIND